LRFGPFAFGDLAFTRAAFVSFASAAAAT